MSHGAHKHTVAAFRNSVPRWLRIVLFLFFSVVFQFSNTAYPPLAGTISGAHQLLKEDLNFFLQMTMVGICFMFPLLFRFKLRFTSRQIIIGCSLVVMVMLFITTISESVPVIAAASFILGTAKMLGTFETLVSIQLIITPNKDYGVFFSVVLGIVLFCGQVSGIWATKLNYDYNWTAIYKIIIGAHAFMIILALLLLKHIRIARKLPLYGIDWFGCFLWCCLFTSLTYIFSYGQVLNWLHSESIQVAIWLSLLFAILTAFRMFSARRPYVSPGVFKIKSVNISILAILFMQPFLGASGSVLGPFTTGVLRLDHLHISSLNWGIVTGIVVGAIFSYYWFLKINGPFKIFFTIAFASLTGYYYSLYFTIGNYADYNMLILPYVLRGFGNMLIFAGVGKYVTKNVKLDIFTQVLCYLAMARNAIGSLIPTSVIGYVEYWRAQDYHNKLSSKIGSTNHVAADLFQNTYHTAIVKGNTTADASVMAGKALYFKVNQQAVLLAGHEISGFMAFSGMVVIIVLTTIHFGRPFLSKIPSWQKLRIILSVKKDN
ncbi:hypothetical protein [Sinomicrobium sp. M5D2P17]